MCELQAYENEIKNFLDEQGRLWSYPAKYKRQIFALFYLASKFEQGRRYTEKEVNQILKSWHTFGDWAMLRRDLFDRRFLNRKPDGSLYWLEDKQPTPASFGLE
jgi:Uncharacterized protein conserved in bacteria